MKRSAVVLGVVLLAATVRAQPNFSGPQLPAAPGAAIAPQFAADTTQPSPTLWAEAAPARPIATADPAPALSNATPAQFPPVHEVRIPYSWQLYAGYTFFRFYEIRGLTNTENGLDIGVS